MFSPAKVSLYTLVNIVILELLMYACFKIAIYAGPHLSETREI